MSYTVSYCKCPKILDTKVSDKMQKVQTKIGLLLQEQGLHCLPYPRVF